MPNKIVAVPVSQSAAEKFQLPEPELSYEVNQESGDVMVHVKFPSVDPDIFKKSKQTLYLSRTANPANIEFELDGQAQVLAIDTQGRQPLQFRCALSVPFIEEKEATGNGDASADASGEVEDDEVV